MKSTLKILLEAVASFFIGAFILFFVLLCYSFKYMIKTKSAFAFVVNGIGAEAANWTVLSVDQIIFICCTGGLILLIIDLIFNIIKLLQNK